MIHTLKPYPAYKDSGVPWLGKVPEHWELHSLRQIIRPIKGRNPERLYLEGEKPPEAQPYLTMEYLRAPRTDAKFYCVPGVGDVETREGDILLLWDGANAGEFLIAKAGVVSSTAALLQIRSQDKRYLYFALKQCEPQIRAFSTGMGIPHVDGRILRQMIIPLPPLPEQSAIVRFLDYMDRRIKRYINAKQKMIKLLSEYKQALIHQAVTGKIDVRTGKPYPSYKDSGVEWLGKVPEHWEVRRIKRIAHINPSKSEVPLTLRNGNAVFLPMERVGTNGHYDASDVRPILSLWNGFTYFRRGDIIVAKITPCFENGKGACLENLPTAIGFGSTEFHVIRPSKAIVTAYLYRLTTLSDFRRLGTDEMTGAAGQQRVPAEFIANFWVPLPSLPEQTAIVEHLDDQTGKIDTAIATARKEIELLREYRERLIADVVTGKVDMREVAELLPEEAEEDIIDDGTEQAVFNEEDETTSEAENELKEETSTEDEL
jgi:type I restriction enzyme S subunit